MDPITAWEFATMAITWGILFTVYGFYIPRLRYVQPKWVYWIIFFLCAAFASILLILCGSLGFGHGLNVAARWCLVFSQLLVMIFSICVLNVEMLFALCGFWSQQRLPSEWGRLICCACAICQPMLIILGLILLGYLGIVQATLILWSLPLPAWLGCIVFGCFCIKSIPALDARRRMYTVVIINAVAFTFSLFLLTVVLYITIKYPVHFNAMSLLYFLVECYSCIGIVTWRVYRQTPDRTSVAGPSNGSCGSSTRFAPTQADVDALV